MRSLVIVTVVGILAVPAWAVPDWPDEDDWPATQWYNADSNLAPSASGGTFTPWIVAYSGSTNSSIQTTAGQKAWYGKEIKRRHVSNTNGAAAMDFSKDLWIEWTVYVSNNPDTHQGPAMSIFFDGMSMSLMSDGNFSQNTAGQPGAWNAQQAILLDGSGSSTDGVNLYSERLLATKNAWHTISAHVIPKNKSASGLVEVEFFIDSGADNTPGSDVIGGDTDYARYQMTTTVPAWDNATKWGVNSANGLISFGGALTGATNRSYDMGTHEIRWTQVPEPAVLVLLGLASLFVLRRRRA